MDRFKFRMWDKKNNIMVYCEEEATKEQIIQYEEIYDKDEDYCCFQYTDLSCLSLYENDFVVEQCTGLKDKNGKLIYEGDIIKDIEGYIGQVKFCDGTARFIIEFAVDISDFSRDMPHELKIIGNIHKNANLLGEE